MNATVETPEPAPGAVRSYFQSSRGPWYGFLFALPVLIGYELLVYVWPTDWINGADAMLQTLLAPFGATNMSHVLAIAVPVAGLLCYLLDSSRAQARAAGIGFRPKYFLLMFAESFVYALFLAPLVNYLMNAMGGGLGLSAGGSGAMDPISKLKAALGAGIFEELVFRVMLLGGLNLLFRRTTRMEPLLSWVLAVIASSLVFSLFHYVGSYADPFELGSFIFRFLAGAVFAILFACRGFGIAVWTHAIYDIIVMLILRG